MSSYWIKIKKCRHHRKVGLRTGADPEAQSTGLSTDPQDDINTVIKELFHLTLIWGERALGDLN